MPTDPEFLSVLEAILRLAGLTATFIIKGNQACTLVQKQANDHSWAHQRTTSSPHTPFPPLPLFEFSSHTVIQHCQYLYCTSQAKDPPKHKKYKTITLSFTLLNKHLTAFPSLVSTVGFLSKYKLCGLGMVNDIDFSTHSGEKCMQRCMLPLRKYPEHTKNEIHSPQH